MPNLEQITLALPQPLADKVKGLTPAEWEAWLQRLAVMMEAKETLKEVMDRIGKAAAEKGLTEQKLNELLAG